MTGIEEFYIRQALRDFCRAYHIEITVEDNEIHISNSDTGEFITDLKEVK